ncbi:MAG: tRNA uracil 4-sulfurtransferase ThiI [Aerococcus sp.]|nr:tRNA uracil 4-sulfurtransferase ThiI [Aerococcus sp.]
MKKKIIVRYGELSVKGNNKKQFINQLARNIRAQIADFPDLTVHPHNDFIFIDLNETDPAPVLEQLQNVFGIQSYSPAYEMPRDFEELKQVTQEVVAKRLKEHPDIKTFKVATSRSDHDFAMDTNDINRELGGFLDDEFPELTAQMKHPDLIVRVKVRFNDFVLSLDWIKGHGGLPVGSTAPAMLMLSGGIDSPVAGYLAMKRGIRPTAVHFASPPYTSPQALLKAKQLTQKLTRFGGHVNFIEIPFTEIQEEIKAHVPDTYLMTITRRMMFRVADRIRERYHGFAIITGESVGQVASQSLESMYAINAVTTTPILRPVVTMDKLEIIDYAHEIDTFDLSIQPFEDCCTVFAPPSPKTRPHMDKVLTYEERLDIDGLVEHAVEGHHLEKITKDTVLEETPMSDFSCLL